MTAFARTLLIVLACIAGLVTLPSMAVAQSSIRVIVNGDAITSYDIAQRARLLPLFGNKGGQKAATEELIDETLKLQEARNRGMVVSDEQVDAIFANMAKERKLSPQRMSQELGKMGIAAETMKRWIKAQMTWRQLVRARARRQGRVSTSEIMSAMTDQGNPDEFTETEYILQQIIFVVPEGSSSKYAAQRRREAENFRLRFPGCDGSLAKAKGLKGVVVHDLGRRDSSQLKGPQGEEIKQTKIGQTTRPSRSGNGFELVAVCSKRDFQSNAAARAEIESQLRLEKAKDLDKEYLAALREKAIIQRR